MDRMDWTPHLRALIDERLERCEETDMREQGVRAPRIEGRQLAKLVVGTAQ